MRLPAHPNIVAFGRVVSDEIGGRLVGFTDEFVSGDMLQRITMSVFKAEWLQQLILVMDFLNKDCGITHQDTSSRNLVVEDSTHSLILFDSNFAPCMTGLDVRRERGSKKIATMSKV